MIFLSHFSFTLLCFKSSSNTTLARSLKEVMPDICWKSTFIFRIPAFETFNDKKTSWKIGDFKRCRQEERWGARNPPFHRKYYYFEIKSFLFLIWHPVCLVLFLKGIESFRIIIATFISDINWENWLWQVDQKQQKQTHECDTICLAQNLEKQNL